MVPEATGLVRRAAGSLSIVTVVNGAAARAAGVVCASTPSAPMGVVGPKVVPQFAQPHPSSKNKKGAG